MFSQPLWGVLDFQGNSTIVKPLDIVAEQRTLFETLEKSQKALRLKIEVATHDNLVSLIVAGPLALHYSGHGQENSLAFEDGRGKVHCISPKQVLRILQAGNIGNTIKFVFVSACNSELIGRAFSDGGVPHVIAVKRMDKVEDTVARLFMKFFYQGVLTTQTVQEAFDTAFAGVETAFQADMNDPKKFLLLPGPGDPNYTPDHHSVRLFQDVPDGRFSNDSIKERPNNLQSSTVNFLGRNVEEQQLIEGLLGTKKLFVLSGDAGVGKSVLALECARYVHTRRMFEGVFVVDFHRADVARSLAAVVASELDLGTHGAVDPAMTNRHLSRLLKEFTPAKGTLLLVLDNVDVAVGARKGSKHCLHGLIHELLGIEIKLIVTCRKWPSELNLTHYGHQVKPLSPTDSAILFCFSCPRALAPSEYDAVVPDARKLSQHQVVAQLVGNPAKLKSAAAKLGEQPLSSLLSELTSMLRDWEQNNAITPLSGNPPSRSNSFDSTPALLARAFSLPSEPELHRLPHSQSDVSIQARRSPPPPPRHQHPRVPPELNAENHQHWVEISGNLRELDWGQFSRRLCDRFASISPLRRLEPGDLHVVRATFFLRDATLTFSPEFVRFWHWWTAVEHALPKIIKLWESPGIIRGLGLTSAQATELLAVYEPGAFLLRPSLSAPGHLAVAFVEAEPRTMVRHMLIDMNGYGYQILISGDADGIAVKRYDSLCDLIIKCQKFQRLVLENGTVVPKQAIFVQDLLETNYVMMPSATVGT